ncbi:hypothetical protein PtA15_18A266 [Puccinia triticina]|uniref:Uncharacterized protein n=1 Tax=Puccinia triticina TaxID=208348 RepID=A0ABY7D9D1_9BASI|nr:uncharacterized protein PtA15_18A266 [Puccinia triticina]WAQ93208.1 hypothetical protein PtA15_18A266 [Puccinia triticina]
MRIWEIYGRKNGVKPLQLVSDRLAVAFCPSGAEVAVSTSNGQVAFVTLLDGTKEFLDNWRLLQSGILVNEINDPAELSDSDDVLNKIQARGSDKISNKEYIRKFYYQSILFKEIKVIAAQLLPNSVFKLLKSISKAMVDGSSNHLQFNLTWINTILLMDDTSRTIPTRSRLQCALSKMPSSTPILPYLKY